MRQNNGFLLRRNGGSSDLISGIVVIACLAAFILFYTHYTADLDKVVRMNLIARRYISAMEMTGYLTPAYQSGIMGELEQIGAYGLSFAESTLTPAAYGSKVVLKVSGRIDVSAITGYDGKGGFTKDNNGGREFTIKREITAKY